MKKRVSKLLAAALFVNLLSVAPVSADIPQAAAAANDGVNFTELAKGNVYFGKAKHPTKLNGQSFFYYGSVNDADWEEAATPVLWQVKGEEVGKDGNGDGKITLLSKYIMNSLFFSDYTENIVNNNDGTTSTTYSNISQDYTLSPIGTWLNDNSAGFLSEFSASEQIMIPTTNVTTGFYTNPGDDGAVTDAGKAGWPKTVSQKVYLPWGTFWDSNKSTSETTAYFSADGTVFNDNLIAATGDEQRATLKGGTVSIRYWLRSPSTSQSNTVLFVNHNTDSSVQHKVQNTYMWSPVYFGVRPVTKLDPSKIVFASEIKSAPTNDTQTAAPNAHMVEGDTDSPNYKLTVLASDSTGVNPYTLSISGNTGETMNVTKGDTISLAALPSETGEDYTINYKAVMSYNNARNIIDYGTVSGLSGNTAINISTADWLRINESGDTVDLYVWLQKNTDTVNEASEPVHMSIALTGGEITGAPTPVPEELDAATAAKIKPTYPDGKLKAVIMSYDDSADWCVNADGKLIEILDANGLKATFNAVPANITENGAFRQKMSQYNKHEIASHSYNHIHLDQDDNGNLTSDETFIYEMTESKKFLEELFPDKDISGLAYPYYYSAGTERLQMVKDAGYRYSRRTDPTNSFDIPDSFYNWNPTMNDLMADNGNLVLPARTQEFIELTPDEMKMFFIWGHSHYYNDTNGYITYFEDFAEAISANLDTIWNSGVLEFVDYVNATRLLKAYKGTEKAICLDNTANNVDVWLDIDGAPLKVAANEKVEIDLGEFEPTATSTPAPTTVPTATPEATEEPTATPEVTAEPTQEPVVDPDPTTEPTAAPTVAPAAAGVIAYDFQNDTIGQAPANLTINAGTNTVTVEKAPYDPPTTAFADYNAFLANAAATQNKGLKFVSSGDKTSPTATINLGKITKDFSVEFSAIHAGLTGLNLELVVGDKTIPIFAFDGWGNTYIMASSRNNATALNANYSLGNPYQPNCLLPFGMIFRDITTTDAEVDLYVGGRYNYTAAGSTQNDPTYEQATLPVGTVLADVDFTQNAVLKITANNTNASEGDYLTLDNLRICTGNFDIKNAVTVTFENEITGAAPMQSIIRTGSRFSRGGDISIDESTKINPSIINYSWQVANDPTSSSNKVLKGVRGAGSNSVNYDGTTRVTIKKPNEKLNISFKVMAGSELTGQASNFIELLAIDGSYNGYFADNGQTAKKGFSLFSWRNDGIMWGPGVIWFTNTAVKDINKWIPVNISYDIATGLYTTNINGITVSQPSTDGLKDIMASSSDTITIGFKHFVTAADQCIMLDDISVVGTSTGPTLELYSDDACTTPATAAAGTVYAKLDGASAMVIIAAYNGDELVTASAVTSGTIASLTIPDGCTSVKAFAWNADTLEPVADSVSLPKA